MNEKAFSSKKNNEISKSEAEERKISWEFELHFDLPKVNQESPPPPPPKIPPRILLKKKFPHILERVELLWGSLELHKYLQQTLFTERSNRQGFPQDVMQALGEIHIEHTKFLKLKKMVFDDVWDLQFGK